MTICEILLRIGTEKLSTRRTDTVRMDIEPKNKAAKNLQLSDHCLGGRMRMVGYKARYGYRTRAGTGNAGKDDFDQ